MTRNEEVALPAPAAGQENSASNLARSVALFSERVAALPGELEAALATPFSYGSPGPSAPTLAALRAAGPWVITGAGGSEGPARMLAELLVAEVGLAAVFRPPSAFFGSARSRTSVCVISQHLSPHAAMALEHSSEAPMRILLTAETTPRPGVHIVSHGPAVREDLLLPRVLGPELATLAVLRWVAALSTEAHGVPPAWASSLSLVPAAVVAALARAERALVPTMAEHGLDRGALVLIATGELGSAAASGLAGRTAEALLRADATVFDVCAFAHGPFQSLYDAPMCILALEGPESTAAFDRLALLPRPGPHRLVRFSVTLPAPLCWLEHGAALAAAARSELRRRPRDLISWPGKGADAPLYDLDSRT